MVDPEFSRRQTRASRRWIGARQLADATSIGFAAGHRPAPRCARLASTIDSGSTI